MGLLKAGAGALGGVLADQWREFFIMKVWMPTHLWQKAKNEWEKEAPTKRETTILFQTVQSFR